MLKYEEFMKIVPEQTKNYINNVLQCLASENKSYDLLMVKKTRYVLSQEEKDKINKTIILLSELNKINTKIEQFGFNKSSILLPIVNKSINYEKAFNENKFLFQIYDNYCYYKGLTPLDILLEYMDTFYTSPGFIEVYNFIFGFNETAPKYFTDSYRNLTRKLSDVNKKEKLEKETLLRNLVYRNLPVNLVELFDEASKIYELLDKSKLSSDDIVSLSLLYSIYNSEDKEVKRLVKVLKLSDEELLLEKMNINKKEDFVKEINKSNPNIYILEKEYQRFFTRGVCQFKCYEDTTIKDVFINLLDRNISESHLVESHLLSNNQTKEETISILINDFDISLEQEVNNIYNNLTKKDIDSLEFATKVYQLIKTKDNYNKKLITNNNDIVTLSLYIANHYFNGKIDGFFNDNGVTFDKVLEVLKLDINKEEIDKLELDLQILIDNYSKYTLDNNIYLKLYDINECNSLILKNIFNKLSNTYNLPDDFYDKIKEHFKDRLNRKNQELLNKYFSNINIDIINYLEIISQVYQYLSKETKLQDKDLQAFSILISVYIRDNKILKFLESKKIDINKIKDFLSIPRTKSITDEIKNQEIDINIELLLNDFSEFISNDKEITIENILGNIFDRNIYNSVLFSKLLYSCNTSYENFDNFAKKYKNYVAQNNFDNIFEVFSFQFIKEYFRYVLSVHNALKECILKEDNNIITNETDIEIISLIYGYIVMSIREDINEDIVNFFSKHGITGSNILSYLNFDYTNFKEDLDKEVDYELFLTNYNKYIDNEIDYELVLPNCKIYTDYSFSVVKKIISKEYPILKDIVSYYNGNYEILKIEVESGKEYQPTLSERIKMLSNTKADNLDLEDISTVLGFGNSLSEHSRYIYDEMPKLLLSESNEDSVKTINSIIDRVYIDAPSKKKNFFERLFLLEDAPDKILNTEAVKELKEEINININTLSKELVGYDTIKKYIEIYRIKNLEHKKIVDNTIISLEEDLSKLNPDNESEYSDYLSTTSHLQIMREKERRFGTSDTLMTQELMKINQTIVNHFITINALEMARDDLIPLIGSELAIALGRNIENQSLELSRNVMDLFKSILTRNVDGARINIEKLKEVGISSETFNLINRDINMYLNDLEKLSIVKNYSEDTVDKETDVNVKKLTLEI